MSAIEKLLRFGEKQRMKRLSEQADYIDSLEPSFATLSDDELRAKTDEFKARYRQGESLEELLFEAFAAVREAARRTLNMRHYQVQLQGGIVLHEGDIAEMKTGEGKTLVATLPLYLNALSGENVHLVTVNDYLAKRDCEWMAPVYRALGMRSAYLYNLMPQEERTAAYQAEITYGTNSEFGFDYLRDNMAQAAELTVQRGHSYAIIDEVDSILIDEARTPLIISGEPQTAAQTYYDFARIVKGLTPGEDYDFDEKFKTAAPHAGAVAAVEKALRIDNLFDLQHAQLVNHLVQALRAESLYQRDRDYVILDGEVKIVDEHTGRVMEGRRWSEGLHQAIEAKEGVQIQEEHITLATITLQNYFRLYQKLAGMSGTAMSEEKEFQEIYGMGVVAVPTNRPMSRLDQPDLIYASRTDRNKALVDEVVARNRSGQPVLLGCVSVEESELVSELLKRRGIKHHLLNAKNHAREAEIVAAAGERGAVTVASPMAGRGTDIKLGAGVADLGGLYIALCSLQESIRIAQQYRGRSGRQGDPGETRAFISGEDEVIRIFAGDRLHTILSRLGIGGQPIESKVLTKQILGAQERIEEMARVSRKNTLRYDDVLNLQREVIYRQRRAVLTGANENPLFADIRDWAFELAEQAVWFHTQERQEEWDLQALLTELGGIYRSEITVGELQGLTREQLVDEIRDDLNDEFEFILGQLGEERESLLEEVSRMVMLQTTDRLWIQHLEDLDTLREGIHLRSMAQKDPLIEYQHEGHLMFEQLGSAIRVEAVRTLLNLDFAAISESALSAAPQAATVRSYQAAVEGGGDLVQEAESGGRPTIRPLASAITTQPAADTTPKQKIGRNQPCWCGSGKKFKICHGR